jgi:hypothetical protein
MLFKERSDMGALDVELTQLMQFWRETSDKDKRLLIDSFRIGVARTWELESAQSGGSSIHSSSTASCSSIRQKTV